MTTNQEWLFSLTLEEYLEWMESEHYEPNPDCSAMLYKMFTENMKQEPCSDYELKSDGDSRERLEADVRDTVTERHVDTIIGWLDRQAAITAHQWESYHNGMMREWMAKTVELQAQVDELTQIAESKRVSFADRIRFVNQIDELTAERDNLADDLLIANKQREWYRKKFGKCLDYADAIHALMDDEGMA